MSHTVTVTLDEEDATRLSARVSARSPRPRMLYAHTDDNRSMPCRQTPGPIALRTFANYGADFVCFAHCPRSAQDRDFTHTDAQRTPELMSLVPVHRQYETD